MGMDLEPINPSVDAPRYPDNDEFSPGEVIPGRYNWRGWSCLQEKLVLWNVDVSEFSGYNDGEEISEETCQAVASAIEGHLSELSEEDREWLQPHIARWRTCGGYRQY